MNYENYTHENKKKGAMSVIMSTQGGALLSSFFEPALPQWEAVRYAGTLAAQALIFNVSCFRESPDITGLNVFPAAVADVFFRVVRQINAFPAFRAGGVSSAYPYILG